MWFLLLVAEMNKLHHSNSKGWMVEIWGQVLSENFKLWHGELTLRNNSREIIVHDIKRQKTLTYTLALLVGRDLAVVDSAGSTSNKALTSWHLSSTHTHTYTQNCSHSSRYCHWVTSLFGLSFAETKDWDQSTVWDRRSAKSEVDFFVWSQRSLRPKFGLRPKLIRTFRITTYWFYMEEIC